MTVQRVLPILLTALATARGGAPDRIPVTDPLVISKCGACHPRDEQGIMDPISSERGTPEGWQSVVKRMLSANRVSLTPVEARAMVRYLSRAHGLAPEEAGPVQFDPERRMREETNLPSEALRKSCTRCHPFARALGWRRTPEDWKSFVEAHATRHKAAAAAEAIAYLSKAAPLQTPEWQVWSARKETLSVAGRWLATAHLPGRGMYVGELVAEPTGNDEFTTRVSLTSVTSGTRLVRTGKAATYGGYAWRGRSAAPNPESPNDPANSAHEVLCFSPGLQAAQGRWFWGQYQEFGFDVTLLRASAEPALLLTDRPSLPTGARGQRIRFLGANLTPSTLQLGPGVRLKRIVSATASEIIAEVDVADDAPVGRRTLQPSPAAAPVTLAVYDRIDYLKVIPESAMASFSDGIRPKGYQQFEAVAFHRGPDGKARTADDIDLGPVEATWSMTLFYAPEGTSTDPIGIISPQGLFTPTTGAPNNNFNLWVIATAKALTAKASLTVSVPTLTFNGRRYVRDLNRWVYEGESK